MGVFNINIQDEQNRKMATTIIAVSTKASKLTLASIKNSIFGVIKCWNLKESLKTQQSLRFLAKNNPSLQAINLEDTDLSKEDLKIFKKIAKECGLKYSIAFNPEKDKITFFFNSGKAEVYEHVYNRLREEIDKKKDVILEVEKEPLKEKIKDKKIILENMKKEKVAKQKEPMQL